MNRIDPEDGKRVDLPPQGGIADQVHLFDDGDMKAINAALAAGRPLLVRGEPGTGKSQLARAAARRLERAFVQHVVDSQTESRDLLWHFDAIARLGEAQLAGALGAGKRTPEHRLRSRLAVSNFVRPGPLWWGFDWPSAAEQASRCGAPMPAGGDTEAWKNGCVVLIDEIDKAESEVPNGLLEALGSGEFTPLGRSRPVVARVPLPLVVITSNAERALPDAFVRRCLGLALNLPTDDEKLKTLLVERGAAHFTNPGAGIVPDPDILRVAAEMLVEDRRAAQKVRPRPLPGQAEYLDLLRAVFTEYPGDLAGQKNALKDIRPYTLLKYDNL